MKRIVSSCCCALIAALGCAGLWAGPVNINTADAETLAAELLGVGPVLAQAIVTDREQKGPFDSPEALTRVRGVGMRIVEQNRANILIADTASPR